MNDLLSDCGGGEYPASAGDCAKTLHANARGHASQSLDYRYVCDYDAHHYGNEDGHAAGSHEHGGENAVPEITHRSRKLR